MSNRKSFKIKVDSGQSSEAVKVKLLCLDITRYSPNVQFGLCTLAVFIFYLLYGYMQELIFTIDGFQSYGWYLTLVQFFLYTIFGSFEKHVSNAEERKIPIKTYAALALLTLGTMGFSNASVGFLNYPTQVIFKSCKLIPVMIGSILIQGKSYGILDFLAAILMCLGLILFTLTDAMVYPKYDTRGVVMISMALLCDAIIGNVQEKSMKKSGASNIEVVLYSYSIGFLYLLIIMICTGDLFSGFEYFSKDAVLKYGYAFIFSLTGYLGIQIVLTLVRTCGAFVAVTVTTCRKAVTILFSFIFFNKPFNFQYVTSGLLVLGGIYLYLYSKNHPLSIKDLQRKCYQIFQHKRSRKYEDRVNLV